MPSLRQQPTLVLCLHRVTQTRFLTNQRAYFLRTVFYNGIIIHIIFITNLHERRVALELDLSSPLSLYILPSFCFCIFGKEVLNLNLNSNFRV